MAKVACPYCASNQVTKAARKEKSAVRGADAFADIRKCGACGRFFEVPWPAWTVWFCLVCGWLTLVMAVLIGVAILTEGKDRSTVYHLAPLLIVPVFLLPSAYRQRRLRHRGSGEGPERPTRHGT